MMLGLWLGRSLEAARKAAIWTSMQVLERAWELVWGLCMHQDKSTIMANLTDSDCSHKPHFEPSFKVDDLEDSHHHELSTWTSAVPRTHKDM